MCWKHYGEPTCAACIEALLAIKDKVATIRAMQILSKDQIVGSNADYEMRTDFDDEAGPERAHLQRPLSATRVGKARTPSVEFMFKDTEVPGSFPGYAVRKARQA